MRFSKGFSLIELMVVLSVATILLGIGVPSFRALIQSQRMTTTVNDLFAAINLTRSEAMQRGARVDLVPADADGKDWGRGWAVFIDKNSDQIVDAGEQVIFSHGPVPQGIAIGSAFTDSASRLYISYNGTGRTRTNASSQSPQLGTLSFVQDTQVKRIKINFLGRPRVCDPAREPTTCTKTADTK
jgi:type IV fimbrial biogenesis protein FimT